MWYVEYIDIALKLDDKEENITSSFPVYSWIEQKNEIQYIYTNRTCLPQKESELRAAHRSGQTMKDFVHWINVKDKMIQEFPGHIVDKYPSKLNINLQFTDKKDRGFNRNREKALNTAKFKMVQKWFKQFNELEHYKRAAKHLRDFKHCTWLENDLWMRDEEFGRQIFCAVFPVSYRFP